jgi:serine/threonine-protein kinase
MAATEPIAPTNFGKYTLLERLGQGGMAEVWKASVQGPAGFRRTLVIKRILPHLLRDGHFVKMFVREARLCARLNHANIVQVYEFGDVGGEFFLAMEYVRGHDLVTVVRSLLMLGPPAPGFGALVVRDVARALAYAHALCDDHGVPLRLIHRDVTPSNVMIGYDGAVKLLDFGIAKALSDANESKTQTGTLKGKFGYLSPEQVEGRDVDHRADLFSCGVVLHEALTGRRLFKGANDLQTLAMVRATRVEPPSLLNPSVPPELDAICLRALAANPQDRYHTGDEMAAELDEVIHQLKWGPERLGAVLRETFSDDSVSRASDDARPITFDRFTVGVLRRHERARRVALGAAGLALLGGLAWLLTAKVAPFGRGHEPAAVAAPALAHAPEESRNVAVRVTSTPPGAAVYVGDDTAPRGQTPLILSLARSNAVQRLVLKASGYTPSETEVIPDSDSRLQLTLVPAQARVAPTVAHHAPVHKKATPRVAATDKKPTGEQSQPDLRRGDVLDPFKR